MSRFAGDVPCGRLFLLSLLLWLGCSAPAHAQLGSLLSPGRLAKPHEALEGISNCQKCHVQGRKVTAEKCLACHAPVADRMARKVGVHRNVKTECPTCHADHGGQGADLRPFDQKRFDHAGTAGFALDGVHGKVAGQCAACHKGRSFLTARATCVSCHADVHKGKFGQACASCHSTQIPFKQVKVADLGRQFDHARTAFPLAGAHQTVACARCHANQVFQGVKFAACTDCHKDPHRQTFGATCTSCHTNVTWRTKKVDHAHTAFPLVGRHATVECAACHRQPSMKVKPPSATCAVCHVDVHRGTFKQDCKACHAESGFEKAPFDHAKTAFALTGKHAGLGCVSCHKGIVVGSRAPASRAADFSGLKTACASCHVDVHQASLGSACDACHQSQTFRVTTFAHSRVPEFFGGRHAGVRCEGCHKPAPPTRPARVGVTALNVTYRDLSMSCAACHRDVHLGQVGAECTRCHDVKLPAFAVAGFSHQSAGFALTGRHATVACAKCHTKETRAFPAGTGTATWLKGLPQDCRGCHRDVHLGQIDGTCERCHTTAAFTIADYRHTSRALAGFFVGRHQMASCAACHKAASRQFPGGRGTTVVFRVGTECVSCHADVHRGALGPDCIRCHRP